MIAFRPLSDTERAQLAAMHEVVLGPLSASDRERIEAARRHLGRIGILPGEKAIPDASPEAEAMAAKMIEIAAGLGGACSGADLIEAGYTPDDLLRHGETARRLAFGLTERTVS